MPKNIWDDENLIKVLQEDGVAIMPTDTIYGLVGSAGSKKAVTRIFKLKNRNKKKKLIILISSIKDLEKFKIEHSYILKNVGTLNKFWPGKVSVIISGTAFRLPKNKKLIEILKKTGPLVAPSANPEGLKPAENIAQAKKYFGGKVDFYLSGGTLKGRPSTLIEIGKSGKITFLRGNIKI